MEQQSDSKIIDVFENQKYPSYLQIPKLHTDPHKLNEQYRDYLLSIGFVKLFERDPKHYVKYGVQISICFTPCTFGVAVNGVTKGRLRFEEFVKLVEPFKDKVYEEVSNENVTDIKTDSELDILPTAGRTDSI